LGYGKKLQLADCVMELYICCKGWEYW